MKALSFEYWNQLSGQIILISSLLSGFSIAVMANLLVYDTKHRISTYILKSSAIAAGSFLVTLFAMTNILMKSTPGYPFPVSADHLMLPRVVGFAAFSIGIIALSVMISLSGWTKSKSIGLFTTFVGALTFLMILLMLAV